MNQSQLNAPELPKDPQVRPDGLLASNDLKGPVDAQRALTAAERAEQAAREAIEKAQLAQPVDPKAPWLTEGDAKKVLGPQLIEDMEKAPGERIQ